MKIRKEITMKEVKITWPENAKKVFSSEITDLLETGLQILFQYDPEKLCSDRSVYQEAHALFQPIFEEAWSKMMPIIYLYVFGRYGKVKQSILTSHTELNEALHCSIEDEKKYDVEMKTEQYQSTAMKNITSIELKDMDKIEVSTEKSTKTHMFNPMKLFENFLDQITTFIFIELIRRISSSSKPSRHELEFYENMGYSVEDALKKYNEAHQRNVSSSYLYLMSRYHHLLLIQNFVKYNTDVTLLHEDHKRVIEELCHIISTSQSYSIPSAIGHITLSRKKQFISCDGLSMAPRLNFASRAHITIFPSAFSLKETYDMAKAYQRVSQTDGLESITPQQGLGLYIDTDWKLSGVNNITSTVLRFFVGEKAYDLIHLQILSLLAEYVLNEHTYDEKIAPLLGKTKKEKSLEHHNVQKTNANFPATVQLLRAKYFPQGTKPQAKKEAVEEIKEVQNSVHEKRNITYNISFFKRLLPRGHHPSPQAFVLASEYGIDLGYSIVLPDGQRIDSTQILELSVELGMPESDVIEYFQLEGGIKRLYTFVDVSDISVQVTNTVLAKTKYTTSS